MPLPRGSDPDRVTFGYIGALQGLSLEAIQFGIRRFLRGECKDVSMKFCPHPPELAEICRHHVKLSSPTPPSSKLWGYYPPNSSILRHNVTKGRAFELIDMGVYPRGSIWCPGSLNDKPEYGDLYGPDPDWKGPTPLLREAEKFSEEAE